ncbi:hypothetical protein Bca4012_017732 [Brassica carinata]
MRLEAFLERAFEPGNHPKGEESVEPRRSEAKSRKTGEDVMMGRGERAKHKPGVPGKGFSSDEFPTMS